MTGGFSYLRNQIVPGTKFNQNIGILGNQVLHSEHGIIDNNAFGHSLLKDTELMFK